MSRGRKTHALVLSLAACLGLGVTTFIAAVPSAAQADAWNERMQDVLLTIRVRKALLADPQLADLNIGVKVRGRVATLWGPVPSDYHAERAIALLRKIPDLAAVQNHLEIRPEEDDPNNWNGDSFLKREELPHREASTQGTLARHVPNTSSRQPSVIGSTKAVMTASRPIIRTNMEEPTRQPLAIRVLALRNGNPSYRPVDLHVADGIVTLRADGHEAVAMYRLAAEISRLADVKRVVVRER